MVVVKRDTSSGTVHLLEAQSLGLQPSHKLLRSKEMKDPRQWVESLLCQGRKQHVQVIL